MRIFSWLSILAVSFTLHTGVGLADVKNITTGNSEGLATDAKVDDWPNVMENLVGAYPGQVKTISLNELSDPNLSGAVMAKGKDDYVFIIAQEETPKSIQDIIAKVFPDYTQSQIEEYNSGVALSATKRTGQEKYDVQAIIYKEPTDAKVKAGAIKIKFANGAEVNFPAGSKLLLQNQKAQGKTKIESYTLSIPTSLSQTSADITKQLDEGNIAYNSQDLQSVIRITMGRPPRADTITLTSANDTETAATIWVVQKN